MLNAVCLCMYILIFCLTCLLSFKIKFLSHRLEIEGKGKAWMRDQKVRFRHGDTGVYLHSHDRKYQRIASGQQEV